MEVEKPVEVKVEEAPVKMTGEREVRELSGAGGADAAGAGRRVWQIEDRVEEAPPPACRRRGPGRPPR